MRLITKICIAKKKTQVSDFPEDFFPPAREVLNNEKQSFREGQLTSNDCLEGLKI